MAESVNLTFTPSSYGDDPVEEIFSAIEDEAARATARRLLREERLHELEQLLVWQGILDADGVFNEERTELGGSRPSELESHNELMLASLEIEGNFDFFNAVFVRRVGWYWTLEGSFDSVRSALGRSTTPLSLAELVELLDGTGLIEHFREMSAEEDDSIYSDSTVYPGLRLYYQQQEEQEREEHREDEYGGSPSVVG